MLLCSRLGILLGFVFLLGSARPARAAEGEAPPAPAGATILEPGEVPTVCTADGTDPDGTSYGYYFSERKNDWISAPWCYPRWGNLEASPSVIVQPGEKVTVAAIPTDDSNSATYAPQTRSIVWQYPGGLVTGCESTDLTCTVIPTTKASSEWQWFEFEVSMPRTFFIDSPGSNCAGLHICAGVTTHAWSFVGVAPAGVAATGDEGADSSSPDAEHDAGGCSLSPHPLQAASQWLVGALAIAFISRLRRRQYQECHCDP